VNKPVSTAGQTALDLKLNLAGGGAGGTGVTSFLGLEDTDNTYVGQARKQTRVNDAETAVEFVEDTLLNPVASSTPMNNGELTIEATDNTTLTFKLNGTDGTVRTGAIILV